VALQHTATRTATHTAMHTATQLATHRSSPKTTNKENKGDMALQHTALPYCNTYCNTNSNALQQPATHLSSRNATNKENKGDVACLYCYRRVAWRCCSVLQCVVVRINVLSMLQRVAVSVAVCYKM